MSSKSSTRRASNPWTIGEDLVVRNVGMLDSFNLASIHPIEEDEFSVSTTASYALPYFQASLFATILEDAITELRILVECNNELRICKVYTDMPLLLANKFDVKQPKLEDELDGIDEKEVDSIEKKFHKLNADRKYFGNVCLDVYKDLSINHSYQGLARHVTTRIDLNSYRVNLQEAEAQNRQLRRELYKQLRQLRNHIKSVTYDTNANIENLKAQIEDYSLIDEITSRYVEGWQRARTEQHVQAIYKAESEPIKSIDYYKQRNEHEQRVHAEVEMFTNIAINEILEKIELWMDKYDKDMEAIDLKFQLQKNKYQDVRAQRMDMEATIENHEVMMKDWNAFKDARAEALAYRNKMTKSAIIVQAWWRGMLVRRQLGPYKEPKKKKPPKK